MYHLTRIGLLITEIGHKKLVKCYVLRVFDPPRLAPYLKGMDWKQHHQHTTQFCPQLLCLGSWHD